MNDTDVGALLLAVFTLVIAAVVAKLLRTRHRDELFFGVTPGEFPAPGQPVQRRRVSGGPEWSGPVAVRFTPPDGLSPAVVGAVLDGRADSVDLAAGLVDLAVKGHYRIVAAPKPPGDHKPAQESPETTLSHSPLSPPSAARDYRLVATHPSPPFAGLGEFERQLLADLFSRGLVRRIEDLRDNGGIALRKAHLAIYREVVDRGWYPDHPRARRGRWGCVAVPIFLASLTMLAIIIAMIVNHEAGIVSLTFPLAILGAGVIVMRSLVGRVTRTAEGSAIRIQALGFREYLTRAEAHQIRFEEAAGLFNRYLPYAMVFGVADRWVTIFGEVISAGARQGVTIVPDLGWLSFADGLSATDLAALANAADMVDLVMGPLSHIGDLANLSELPDLADLGSTLGDFSSSVGDIVDLSDGGCLDGAGCDF